MKSSSTVFGGMAYFPAPGDPPDGLLQTIGWTTSTLVDSSEDWAGDAVNRQWPGIMQEFNPLLPADIDEADLSAIPTLVQAGQKLAADKLQSTVETALIRYNSQLQLETVKPDTVISVRVINCTDVTTPEYTTSFAGKNKGQQHCAGLRDDQKSSLGDKVHHHSAPRRNNQRWNRRGESHDAERQIRMSELIHQPALGNDLHPRAGIRDQLSAKIKLEIAMSQSRERIRRGFDAWRFIR